MAFENASKTDDGWVNLSRVGDYMSRIKPDLHPSNYGYKAGGLRKFVEATGVVDVRTKSVGVFIRLKEGDDETSAKDQHAKSRTGQFTKSRKENDGKSQVTVQCKTKEKDRPVEN
jgi:hypothetical protein